MNAIAIIDAIEIAGIKIQRLYCIKIEQLSHPIALAPRDGSPRSRFDPSKKRGDDFEWRHVASLYDIHSRTMEQISNEIESVTLNHRSAMDLMDNLWKITIYYWSGTMKTLEACRHMGRGEDFIYSDNPQGDLVLQLPSIYLNL